MGSEPGGQHLPHPNALVASLTQSTPLFLLRDVTTGACAKAVP